MSIADAVRARELEARVAALEQRIAMIDELGAAHVEQGLNLLAARVAELEKGGGEVSEHSQAMRLVQGQLNSMRARLDKVDAPR
jgi:uncharacterized coiled-coil protein SlyX